MEAAAQATDQIVRFSLEGVEYVIRLTGKTAAHSAALAAALGRLAVENHKSKGAQRLATMLKSGRELTVFSVPQERLNAFAQEAKRYGVTYCALRDTSVDDGVVDLLVRAEDAARINRIVERHSIALPEQDGRQNPPRGRAASPPDREKGSQENTNRAPLSSRGSESSSERPSLLDRLDELGQEQRTGPQSTKRRVRTERSMRER